MSIFNALMGRAAPGLAGAASGAAGAFGGGTTAANGLWSKAVPAQTQGNGSVASTPPAQSAPEAPPAAPPVQEPAWTPQGQGKSLAEIFGGGGFPSGGGFISQMIQKLMREQPPPPGWTPPPFDPSKPMTVSGGVGATAPNPDPAVPSEEKRFDNGQQIQDAYRNNWNPNPVLLRAILGRR